MATFIIIEVVPVVAEVRPFFFSIDARPAHVVVFWDNGTGDLRRDLGCFGCCKCLCKARRLVCWKRVNGCRSIGLLQWACQPRLDVLTSPPLKRKPLLTRRCSLSHSLSSCDVDSAQDRLKVFPQLALPGNFLGRSSVFLLFFIPLAVHLISTSAIWSEFGNSRGVNLSWSSISSMAMYLRPLRCLHGISNGCEDSGKRVSPLKSLVKFLSENKVIASGRPTFGNVGK